MLKSIASIFVCGALGSIFSIGAQAFPASLAPAQRMESQVTPVRNGCGLGFHRNPRGYCVRNGYYVVPPPDYVPPPPPPVFPLACPYGYYLGQNGLCYPYYPGAN